MKTKLQKMRCSLENSSVRYFLGTDEGELQMNQLLGSEIELQFTGKIFCDCCGKRINKTFFNGYCYNCFSIAPEAEECVLNPEKCRAHEGIARDMAYAQEHCLSPQYVYLASTGGIKVGVTRSSQVPTRWIDQGALCAVPIARTPNRYTAGCIEVALKQFLPDKSNWRKLITGENTDKDSILATRNTIYDLLPTEYREYFLPKEELVTINYPILSYLPKAISINLDKQAHIKGTFVGIRGQYILIENCGAINIRNHTGYEVNIHF